MVSRSGRRTDERERVVAPAVAVSGSPSRAVAAVSSMAVAAPFAALMRLRTGAMNVLAAGNGTTDKPTLSGNVSGWSRLCAAVTAAIAGRLPPVSAPVTTAGAAAVAYRPTPRSILPLRDGSFAASA